jgi:hypothetical protein
MLPRVSEAQPGPPNADDDVISTIRLVAFDVAGTTVLDGDAVTDAMHQALAAFGLEVSLDAIRSGWVCRNRMPPRLEHAASPETMRSMRTTTFETARSAEAQARAEAVRWRRWPAEFDVRHRFMASYVWELPIARGRRFGETWGPTTDFFLGGWQLTGIHALQRGLALTANVKVRPFSISEANGRRAPT